MLAALANAGALVLLRAGPRRGEPAAPTFGLRQLWTLLHRWLPLEVLLGALLHGLTPLTSGVASGCESATPRSFECVEFAIPELRSGSCVPKWLLERRRCAEQVPIPVIATSYLLGVVDAAGGEVGWTVGIEQPSKSQVSDMAKRLDAQVEAFRSRAALQAPHVPTWR